MSDCYLTPGEQFGYVDESITKYILGNVYLIYSMKELFLFKCSSFVGWDNIKLRGTWQNKWNIMKLK